MTGFGSARAQADAEDGATLSAACEVRSVNHKHLQAKVRLPQELSVLEAPVISIVRSTLARGAVQVAIDVKRSGGCAPIELDDAVCARYVELQSELAQRHGLEPIRSVRDLIGLPGVISSEPSALSGESSAGPEADLVRRVVQDALAELVEMRVREGAAMGRDLAKIAGEIESVVARIEERAPGVLERHGRRLIERVAELSANVETSESDLAREIALLADKLDLSEELARLASHIEQLRGLLAEGGSVGRKLDFLAQEFMREANTIGSKCGDPDLAHLVVELKTWVERMREQVQNVE